MTATTGATRPLAVSVNVRNLTGPHTGIEIYMLELLRALAATGQVHIEALSWAPVGLDLPGVEETVVQNVQGTDLASDPKSIPSASELAAALQEAPPELAQPSLLDRAGVTDDTPARTELPQVKPTAAHSDAPYCMQCGVQMQRAGSCHACPSCGSTSGCS